MFTTLVDVDTLQSHLEDPSWVIVDCRFSLADTEEGRRAYAAAHIPGAVYAHLDEDLSGPPVTDYGRHPLPAPQGMVRLFARLGIGSRTQVVAYDNANGMIAARLWWMLHYMGHEAAAVLDGGWDAWAAVDAPTRSGVETNETAEFSGSPRTEWLVTVADVPAQRLLVDSRDPERYRGEIEPIDPQPGHIPGAVNFFFQETWGENGRYLPPEQLRTKMKELLQGTPPGQATFYCGSGVSACVNLLALAHAGLSPGKLYVGSWSEWSRDPERPIAKGSE